MRAAFPLSSAPLELQAGLNDQRGRAMKLKAGGGIEDWRFMPPRLMPRQAETYGD
jgi:hypothetical protein